MMKCTSHIIIVVVACVLFGCCRASLAQSRDAPLPHSMKGYEVYSWKSRGEWYFSLLVGTNRLKTFSEVSSTKIRVRGVRALKARLNQLAGGEEVTWSAGLVPRTVLPPEKIVDEVKSYCERRGIVLRVNRRGARTTSNSGMHPTAGTLLVKLNQWGRAAGDAGRYVASPILS
jgi:hypothetical protein